MAFRWAILGAGNIAGKFADAVMRADGCVLSAVASRSMERAEAFARRHGIPAAYGDYAEMLQHARPDAVYIATLPGSHAALTRLCVAHGVPVLCEKAMFMSSAEAEAVLGYARERGIFAMEAMWSRFLPAVREMKRQLDAGGIGSPCFAEFALGWRTPDHPGSRFFDAAQGGGAACDLMVYGYELAEYFFGPPEETRQVAVTWGPSGVDETEAILLRWPAKGEQPPLLAVLTASITANLDERAVIAGPGGTFRMPKPHMAKGFTCMLPDGTETEWHDLQTINGFVYEVEEVVRCVQAGLLESPVVPHALTIRCARLFDAINAAKPER
ncbi:MAG: Gfo/Idh/MocA family oxidoreductase [Clostridia bacterium]|nr:Gfo/Idh/MocA family oxidoreductase [Clostridia bacterium]